MENPPNLTYCKVIGNFKAFIADGLDEDDLPDWVPMRGTGVIYPNLTSAKNLTPGQKSTYFTAPVPIEIDQDGDLGRNGKKYVMVLAPNEASGLNPYDFNYTISFTLGINGETTTRQFGPYSFDVTPGGTIDIVDIIPVESSTGTPIIQGPPGIQGPSGPLGPTPNLTIGTVTTTTPNPVIGPQGPQGEKGDPGGIVDGTILGSVDLNTIQTSGVYRQDNSAFGTIATNHPVSLGTLIVNKTVPTRITQTFLPAGTSSLGRGSFVRGYADGTWSAWKFIATSRTDQTAGRAIYLWDEINNREQLIYGDTGWRDIYTSHGINMTPSSTGPTLRIRRQGSVVTIVGGRVTIAAGKTQISTALPAGFKQEVGLNHYDAMHSDTLATWLGRVTLREFSSSVPNCLEANLPAQNTWLGFQITFMTPDAWPTSLPGTASGTIPNL